MLRLKINIYTIVIGSMFTFNTAMSYTLYMDNGEFFGPGDAIYNDTGITGVNRFPDAQITNIELTSDLAGIIPFANNGAEEPNVIAEKLARSGPVDGMVSDGTLINENADTALRLNFRDPRTGESADVVVIAERSNRADGGEVIGSDAFGNLTFSPNVVADPGDSSLIARFNPVFTTGYAEIPFSIKTQMGEHGGVDSAGPLASGRMLIGRIGDFDQDGFIDGTLVLAENSPLDLIVARGNPIAQRRPFLSDIPIAPAQAIFLTLNGILNNYPHVFSKDRKQNDFMALIIHLKYLNEGVEAILGNLRSLIPQFKTMDDGDQYSIQRTEHVRDKFENIQHIIDEITSDIDKRIFRTNLIDRNLPNPSDNISKNINKILRRLIDIKNDFDLII